MKSGTFQHLLSPPLDSGNKSANLLLKKGFRSHNCFVFDSFIRRVNIPGRVKRGPREIWPEFADCYDRLHSKFRALGGLVTLVMGDNAVKAYNDVIRNEHVDKEKLFHTADFDVWAERSRFVSSILFLFYFLLLNCSRPIGVLRELSSKSIIPVHFDLRIDRHALQCLWTMRAILLLPWRGCRNSRIGNMHSSQTIIWRLQKRYHLKTLDVDTLKASRRFKKENN